MVAGPGVEPGLSAYEADALITVSVRPVEIFMQFARRTVQIAQPANYQNASLACNLAFTKWHQSCWGIGMPKNIFAKVCSLKRQGAEILRVEVETVKGLPPPKIDRQWLNSVIAQANERAAVNEQPQEKRIGG